MSSTTWGHHRGRQADSPSEIPKTGWKDTFTRVKRGIKSDHLSMVAAAMAYYALFALVPALTSMILMYAWISDPAEITSHIQSIAQFIPEEVQKMLNEQLTTLASQAPSALGFSAIGSLLIALWSASKGSKAIIEALNIIYEEDETRGFIKFNLLAIGLTFMGIILGLLSIAAVVVVPLITGIFNFGPATEVIATAASWLVLLALFSFFLSFTYRFAPNRENAKWKWVSWGAVIAAVLFAIASAGFAFYANQFADFNKTYGSFGAIIVLMMWFYISSFVVLLGAEINSELEHQTMKDSTTGSEKPLGTRGAKMADTVGPTADEVKTSGARISDAQDHHRGLWH